MRVADATLAAIGGPCDWLVVDHYLLGAAWHSAARRAARRIMVIDDLANRALDCDLLLDQTFGRDAADGRMRLTPLLRRFDIRWSKAASQKLFDQLEHTARELAKGVDATPFYALEAGPLGKFTTVHPLGGCPMADDADHGVVDDFGRVHGYPGRHILDGSIVPTALGVNPSKTIAALAERGIAQVIADGGH